jgi:2-dehydro-3-deoxygalactonokinase
MLAPQALIHQNEINIMAPFFLSCDWGTTSFRLRCIQSDSGQCLGQWHQPIGVKAFHLKLASCSKQERDMAFGSFLQEACDKLLEQQPNKPDLIQVILSGMTTSTIGWMDLPYAKIPFPLDGSAAITHQLEGITPKGHPLAFTLISGVCSEDEMMRGEETELIGLFSMACHSHLASQCLALLPGTHCKHIQILKDAITGIQTFMTGECLESLSQHSILAANTDMATLWEQGFQWQESAQEKAFEEGVARAQNHNLLGSLFQARTRGVLHQLAPSVNIWFLAGLLVGEEWKSIKEQYPKDLPILLAAGNKFSHLYRHAAHLMDVNNPIHVVQPEAMELASVAGHMKFL